MIGKYIVFILVGAAIFVVAIVGVWSSRDMVRPEEKAPVISPVFSPTPAIATTLPVVAEKVASPTPLPAASPVRAGVNAMPFIVQAPIGNWSNPVFQNACEEASVIMVMRWAQGNAAPITAAEALREIEELVDFQKENYGHYLDSSAADTAQLIRDYFNHNGVEAMVDVTAQTIRAELAKGNVLIVPANGRKIPNPYYTPPGPERHMLVIKGYDAETDEFITNDPGTRRGESFRYPVETLVAAVRDYPTGDHEPIGIETKAMIVIQPTGAF